MPKRKMSKPRKWKAEDDPPATPEAVFAKIAEVMEIPEANRPKFVSRISRAVRAVIIQFVHNELLKELAPSDRRAIKRVARAANTLVDAIRQAKAPAVRLRISKALTSVARMDWRERYGRDPDPKRDKLSWHEFLSNYEPEIVAKSLATFVKTSREAVRLVSQKNKPKRSRGHPRGSTNRPARFLAREFIRAAMDFGGTYSVRPAAGTGALVKALEYCQPLLPQAFRLYSPSTLENIRDSEVPRWRALTNKSKK
jgi:hypothetical protein